MKFKNLALSVALSAFSVFSYAQNVTEGIVIEGDSLPIGVALGDSRQEVEAAVGSISEFDLQDPNRSYCTTPEASGFYRCTFIANDDTGAELGEVIVGFNNGATSSEEVTSLRWSFENWTTSAGVSLADLKTVNDASELEALYPDARVRVFNSAQRSVVIVQSFTDGITMVYSDSARPSRFNGSYGSIFSAVQ